MATATAIAPAELPHPTSGPRIGEPVWEIALQYPLQGEWTTADYLSLGTEWPIEFVNGSLEFLPMPTFLHQLIVDYFHERLKAFIGARENGLALQGPLRIRVGRRVIRLPDVAFFRPERIPADTRELPTGADLVMEVVSEGERNRQRDYVSKRREYARAGIGEYWIVDPQERRITVLALVGNDYCVHGEFGEGQQATSALFPGFSVDVTAVFAAGEGPTPAIKKTNPTRKQRKRKHS